MAKKSNGRSSPSEQLRRLLIDEGFKETLVWQQAEPAESGPTAAEQDSTGPKSAAERQAEQTVRDKENSWARCYAKAPNDPDAKELVSQVAKAIDSPLMRQAIKVTLARPHSVFRGEKVRGLRGIRRVVVCRLIGDDGVGVT
ncbi:MAG: hypothetical protein WCA36_10350 [Pseudolabrys sp.]